MSIFDRSYLFYSLSSANSTYLTQNGIPNNKNNNTLILNNNPLINLGKELLNLLTLENNLTTTSYGNSNNTEIIEDHEVNSYGIIQPKQKYLSLLLMLSVLLFSLSYYFSLYKKSKSINNKSLRESISIAFLLKAISLLYSYLTENPKLDNRESYFNFALTHFSTIYFQVVLLNYISFIIEKYYLLKVRKVDIFLTHFFFLFKLAYYILYFVFILIFLAIKDFLTLDYVFFVVNGSVAIFISVLYMYYGVSLAKIYADKYYMINNFNNENIKNNILNNANINLNQNFNNVNNVNNMDALIQVEQYGDTIPNPYILLNNLEETSQMNYKILNMEYNKALRSKLKTKLYIINLTASITQFFNGLAFFVLGINYYGKPYFKIMNPNMFDFITVLFGTLICGFVLGYTKTSKNNDANLDKMNDSEVIELKTSSKNNSFRYSKKGIK